MSNKYISLTYDLYVLRDGKEELIESTTLENPLTFCSGLQLLLPKFEDEVTPLAPDDTFDFSIEAADAYGLYNKDLVREVPRTTFEQDGSLDEQIFFVGNTIPLMDSDGNHFNAVVSDITDSAVTVDINHPLAGYDLHFKGKIIDIHDASQEELDRFTQHACGGCGGCGGGHCNNGECGDGDCGNHDCHC
ncbi:MAG: peptidylprolyl isomerase [Paludibacteraceae bacterium]|nr:peptidylprolyl isomerase [Paludibacteraceae bacterium]